MSTEGGEWVGGCGGGPTPRRSALDCGGLPPLWGTWQEMQGGQVSDPRALRDMLPERLDPEAEWGQLSSWGAMVTSFALFLNFLVWGYIFLTAP